MRGPVYLPKRFGVDSLQTALEELSRRPRRMPPRIAGKVSRFRRLRVGHLFVTPSKLYDNTNNSLIYSLVYEPYIQH